MKKLNIYLTLIFSLVSLTINAQEKVQMADMMRSNGKIFVVVGIILIVLAGLILYLFFLDKKVKRLENILFQKNQQTK